MNTVTRLLAIMLALAVAVIVVRRFGAKPQETPTDVAYQICGACGLERSEVDQLISDMRRGTLTREENLDLFYATFERREDAELCVGCAEAVLDAAGG